MYIMRIHKTGRLVGQCDAVEMLKMHCKYRPSCLLLVMVTELQALSKEAQRAQVQRWKQMNPSDRPKALVGLPAEVASRLKEADMVQQMATIQKVHLHFSIAFRWSQAMQVALDMRHSGNPLTSPVL